MASAVCHCSKWAFALSNKLTKSFFWRVVIARFPRILAIAVSLAKIQLFINTGWLTRKGAIPRPVELPIPRYLLFVAESSIAVLGDLHLAICSTSL